MPKVSREKYFKNDKIVVKNNKTGKIRKLIFPHEVDFGLSDYPEFAEKVRFYNGLSGTLQQLPDGTSYLIAGGGVEITTGSNGAVTIALDGSAGGGTITSVTAGTALSGGGSSGGVTVNLDLSELSAVTPTLLDSLATLDSDGSTQQRTTISNLAAIQAGSGIGSDSGQLTADLNSLSIGTIVGADSIAFIDADDNVTKKDTIGDFLTAVAGNGISVSSNQLVTDLNELSDTAINTANDSIIFIDANDNATKKDTIADFVSGIAGSGLSASSGQLSVTGLDVSQGGTNSTSFSDKSVIITQDSGTDTLIAEPMTTNGSLLIGGTSGPAASTLTAGTNISITNADGSITITASGVAPGAAGIDTQVQFNDGGSALGTDSNFTFNKANDALSVTNISGSLTQLTDGTSYLIASGSTTITSQSNGAIKISSVNSQYNAGDGIRLVGDTLFEADLKEGGGLEFNITQIQVNDSIVATLTGSDFSGTVKAPAFSGSLTQLEDGTSYLIAGDNVTIVSESNGSITINSIMNSTEIVAGSDTQVQFNDGGSSFGSDANFTFNKTTDTLSVTNLSSSLTRLTDGTSYLVAGNNITITTQSNGSILFSSTDTNTEYTAGNGLDLIGTEFSLDLKSNGGLLIDSTELSIDDSVVATLTGSQFSGNIGATGSIEATSFFSGSMFKAPVLTGSLTQLHDGSSYLIAGNNITITSQSNGSIIISSQDDDTLYTAGTGLILDAGEFSINDSIVATLTGSQFSGTIIAPSFSGSLTHLEDGTSYLIAGTDISITTGSNGAVTISSTGAGGGGSIDVVSGSTSVSTVSTLAASDGFILNDEGSGRAALTSSIGISEDGDYTDGLFTDFTPQTRLGIAIDRFNEILKLLAPSPAPALDDIDVNVDGTDAYLSFGASNDLGGEATPYYSVSTTAGFSAVDVNELYETDVSSNNLRAAIFAGATEIVGDLNEDVSADGDNYPANSFGNADQGELRLEINGSVIHTVDLTSFTGTGDPGSGTAVTNSTGSCFTNFSTAAAGTLDNGTAFPNFQHRTGRYKVITSDQRQGWNYLRVLHVYGTTTITTNYVEWVNDADSNALAAADNSLTFIGSGSLHLSGIEYFTSGSAEYLVKVDNAYRNIYDTTNITFTTATGGSLNTSPSFSISAQSKPTIDTGAGEDHTKALHITGSASITATQMLSGSITAGVSVTHPLKSNLSNAGQASDEGILIYNRSNTSTALVETFRRENYRIISGAYDTQASLTDAGNVWDSTTHMTASNGGHTNGLQFFNSRLYSPINTLNSGDFSTFSNGPSENPDYSGETGQRTFYRWFRNETGSTQYDFTVAINGSSTTIVNAATALNSGRIRVFVKFPNNGTRETGWLDLATEFVLDSYADNDGAHTANGGLSFDSTLNATNYVTLGTAGILDDDYIGLRIEADASWTGYVSQITVSFGAGTGTITAIPDLDDIDCNDDGTDCNLSFGTSKSITGYTNSSTAAGFSAVDLNGLYQTATSGNNLRQSVFQLDRIVEGDLNEDVSAVSPDYVANSFSDANSGSLALEVNGNTVHTVEITGSYNLVGSGEPGSGTGTSLNGNGSGFFDLSVWRPAEYDNGVPYYLENYRTGKFRVHTADQRNGWNYARVVHSGSWGARATNYVEWVNDNNADAMSSAGVEITSFGDDTFAYSSGVKFFTSPSGSILSRISNIYKNVYSDSSSAISFINLSNATGAQIIQSGSGLSLTKTTAASTDSLQTLNTNADSQNELLHVSGTVNFTLSKSLPGSFTTAYNCAGGMRFLHPFKTQLDLSTQTATDLLVWTPSNTSSTNYNEYFTDETYRLVSSSYDLQSDITGGSYDWNSQRSINNNATYPEHATGLLVYDTYIMSPLKGGASGDFRNNDDGGSIEGPAGNPNYTTLTNATREFYRGFLNPTTNDLARITIVIYGSGTIVPLTTSLGANGNVHVELKIPEKTGFLDLGTASGGSGNISDGDGCLFGDPDFTIDADGATNVCTFNGVTVDGTSSGAEYFVIKISADEDWTGYIDRISVTWSG